MTEDEASKLWCPMVRVPHYGQGDTCHSINRGTGMQDGNNCIGSKCMMWRWDYFRSSQIQQTEDARKVENGRVTYIPVKPEGDGWYPVRDYEVFDGKRQFKEPINLGFSSWSRSCIHGGSLVSEAHGYCGLAGKMDKY